jgi:SH3-like domain-containing protein
MPYNTRLMWRKSRKSLGLWCGVGVCALLALTLGPSNASADPIAVGVEHCVVNVRSDDRLNMRAQANARAPIVTRKAYASCGITVASTCLGSWCPVEDGHYRGWAHRHYIAMVSPARYCVTGVRSGDRLNVRAFPSPQSRMLTTLARDQCGIAFLPYAVGNWQKIRVVGWEGWANRLYLTGQ